MAPAHPKGTEWVTETEHQGKMQAKRKQVALLRKALGEIKTSIRRTDSPYQLDAEREYLLGLIDDALYATDGRRG